MLLIIVCNGVNEFWMWFWLVEGGVVLVLMFVVSCVMGML